MTEKNWIQKEVTLLVPRLFKKIHLFVFNGCDKKNESKKARKQDKTNITHGF